MESRKIKPRQNVLLFAIVCFFFLISACGGGRNSSGDDTSNTGSISFNLDWQNSRNQHNVRQQSPGDDVCVDYAIDRVNVRVENSSNAEVANANWLCSAHEGTLENVSVGSGMTLFISGTTVAGDNVCQGQITDISVSKDQTTDVGTVHMYCGGEPLVWDSGNWDEASWN